MTAPRRRRALVALAVAVSVCFAIAAHMALVDGLPPTAGALLSLVPLAFFVAWALRRSRHRVLAAGLAVLLAAALWAWWPQVERHFPEIFFIEHAGINLALAIVFGRTLLAGREPLITRFALMLHGTIPPEVQRYTRRVTLAWTVFFATLCLASIVLYAGGFHSAWSLLANIASPVLIGAMFVVEYAVRLRALPQWERVGILGGIRAFSRHFATARVQAPR